jgi:hypothetical protein
MRSSNQQAGPEHQAATVGTVRLQSDEQERSGQRQVEPAVGLGRVPVAEQVVLERVERSRNRAGPAALEEPGGEGGEQQRGGQGPEQVEQAYGGHRMAEEEKTSR